MRRRSFLAAGVAAAPLAIATSPAAAQAPATPPPTGGKTYVLVHGSWCGGWVWAPVAERLRAQGHRVFTPTQTGLGERRHLLSRDITLDTFVTDLTNMIEAEELGEVVLVAHSFGGVPASGAADRLPERIRHLVYLDAVILQGGQSLFGIYPPEVANARRRAAEEAGGGVAVPVPPLGALGQFGLPPGPLAEWVYRRMTPHPLGTYETPLRLERPVGAGRPRTYVASANPPYAPTEAIRRQVRGQEGWNWVELPTGHFAWLTMTEEVTRLLAAIG
jgi:pimeloyl-ACP methyl ester carboxylesterase